MTPTATDITRTLAALGDSPDSIADTLLVKGIQGACNDADECVIAHYLAEQYPGCRFAVEPYGIHVTPRIGYVYVSIDDLPVSGFVREFDTGRWPGLVAS